MGKMANGIMELRQSEIFAMNFGNSLRASQTTGQNSILFTLFYRNGYFSICIVHAVTFF